MDLYRKAFSCLISCYLRNVTLDNFIITVQGQGVCKTPEDAVADSVNGWLSATKAIDDDTISGWYSQSGGSYHWIYFDMGQPVNMDKLRVYLNDTLYVPMTFDVQVSNNATDWTTVVSNYTISTARVWNDIIFTLTNARYVRLYITDFTNNYAQCAEVDICVQTTGINISGTIYTNKEKTANVGPGVTVGLSIRGEEKIITTTSAGGVFSFDPQQVATGDILTLFIDNHASYKGSLVTKAIEADITDIDMFTHEVVIRHEGPDPVTNTDLGKYDKDDDPDINFTSNDGTLSIDEGNDLYIWAGKTFLPDGDIFCGGSWIADSGSTFVPGSNTVTFISTETGNTITTNNQSFYNLVFNGTGGSWSFEDNVTIDNNFTILAGTVTAPSSGTITIGNNWDASGGTFIHNNSEAIFNAIDSGNTIDTGNNGNFYNLTFNGIGGEWYFKDDATIDNNFTITNGIVIGPTEKFANYGIATYENGGSLVDISIDSLGNIYIAGYKGSWGSEDIIVLKYDSSGELDTSWGGGDGIVIYNSGSRDLAQGITVDSSGNTYVVGYKWTGTTNRNDIMVLKLDSIGSLDTTWGGGNGIVTYDSGSNQDDYGQDIAVDSSGNIYVVGYQSTNGNDIVILKYDSMGSLDTSWGGGDGIVIYNSGGTRSDYGNSIAVDSSGNTYVTGYQQKSGWGYDIVVLKYNSTGTLDTTWGGGDGKVIYSTYPFQYGLDITLDVAGNIYVTGYMSPTFSNDLDIICLKYDSNGTLDTTWGGGDGVVIYNSGGTQDDIGRGISADFSGNIYVVGSSIGRIIILKYDSNGALDTTWGGGDGIVTYNSGSGYGITVDSSDNTYVVGSQEENIVILKHNPYGYLFGNGTADLSVGGNWSNSGTFNHNNCTVTFNGTSGQTITSGGSEWNSITINNASAEGVSFTDGFTCSTLTNETPGSTMYFASGETATITATGGLRINGTSGSLTTLRRYGGSGTDQWMINPSGGSWSVSYVDVQDSNNLHANPINPVNSTDSGNNTNWFP